MLPARKARNTRAIAPISTKSPTQKSVFSRVMINPCMSLIAEHQRGEYKIQPQHQQRAGDDGACGGARYALWCGLGGPAGVQRDQRDRNAEHHAFDDTVKDVVEYIHAALH